MLFNYFSWIFFSNDAKNFRVFSRSVINLQNEGKCLSSAAKTPFEDLPCYCVGAILRVVHVHSCREQYSFFSLFFFLKEPWQSFIKGKLPRFFFFISLFWQVSVYKLAESPGITWVNDSQCAFSVVFSSCCTQLNIFASVVMVTSFSQHGIMFCFRFHQSCVVISENQFQPACLSSSVSVSKHILPTFHNRMEPRVDWLQRLFSSSLQPPPSCLRSAPRWLGSAVFICYGTLLSFFLAFLWHLGMNFWVSLFLLAFCWCQA